MTGAFLDKAMLKIKPKINNLSLVKYLNKKIEENREKTLFIYICKPIIILLFGIFIAFCFLCGFLYFVGYHYIFPNFVYFKFASGNYRKNTFFYEFLPTYQNYFISK
jgi:hypothetical protein